MLQYIDCYEIRIYIVNAKAEREKDFIESIHTVYEDIMLMRLSLVIDVCPVIVAQYKVPEFTCSRKIARNDWCPSLILILPRVFMSQSNFNCSSSTSFPLYITVKRLRMHHKRHFHGTL